MTPYYQDDLVTLYHGDCADVLPLMAGIDAVITDPPYGVNYQSNWSKDGPRFDRLAGDDEPPIEWIGVAFGCVCVGALACFCAWQTSEVFRAAIQDAGWRVSSQGVWDREDHGMGDLSAGLAPQHDLFWFATKGGFAFHGKRPTSVYRARRLTADRMLHPTQKPEPLMVTLVMDIVAPGGIVLDPFMGSGSTVVAAKRAGRRAIGIEIEERYCEIAARRCSQGTLAEMFQ